MENSSPEKTITAIREATAIIDSKSVIDRQFPDLHKTFTGKEFSYILFCQNEKLILGK